MGDFELLTIIFTILKATDKIDWSWWWVFSPMIIKFLLFIIVITYTFVSGYYDRNKF
jgi:hypothetical protein